jgi:hypothetical protein
VWVASTSVRLTWEHPGSGRRAGNHTRGKPRRDLNPTLSPGREQLLMAQPLVGTMRYFSPVAMR